MDRRDARLAGAGFRQQDKVSRTFRRRRGDEQVRSTVNAAKLYLYRLRSPDVTREGPLHTFKSVPHADAAARAIQESLPDIDCIDEKTWWAPSPWHAAAWLMNEAAATATGVDTYPTLLRMGRHRWRGALLFRGQRSVAWPIVSRISRSVRRDRDVAAMRRLAFALDEAHRQTEAAPTTTEAHFALAQHYDIATHLLDLTVDPRVAVFFACDGALDRDLVAVHWIDFTTADELGLQLVLAPPWVRRIYNQRGIFIDTTKAGGDLTAHFHRIVFPADRRFIDSEFGSRQTIYGGPSWFQRAVGWAKSSRALAEPENAPDLWRRLRKATGDPGFAIESIFADRMAEQPDLLVDLVSWLALKKNETTVTLDCRPLLRLIQHNEPFFVTLFQTTNWLLKQGYLGKDGEDIKPTHFTVYVAAMIDCYQRAQGT